MNILFLLPAIGYFVLQTILFVVVVFVPPRIFREQLGLLRDLHVEVMEARQELVMIRRQGETGD
jgi:hypothetical protein